MKVVITARDFVTEDTRAIDLLRAQGYDVVDYSRESIGNGISEEALAAYVGDEEALAQALRNGQIRGAGVDVYDQEPCTDSPLRDCANAVLTPHTAPYTSENFNALNLKAAENVIAFYNHTLEEKYRLV